MINNTTIKNHFTTELTNTDEALKDHRKYKNSVLSGECRSSCLPSAEWLNEVENVLVTRAFALKSILGNLNKLMKLDAEIESLNNQS